MHVIKVPEERRSKLMEKKMLTEIIPETLPNLVKDKTSEAKC